MRKGITLRLSFNFCGFVSHFLTLLRRINMVVDYPRPTMPMYAQNTNNAAYIQSLPLVPSLGNTVPSLSSLGKSSRQNESYQDLM